MKIEPTLINSWEELDEIEDEVFRSVKTNDTRLNRTFIEINYDNTAWLMISDQARHMRIVKIPMKTIEEDIYLKEHLLRHYFQAKRFIYLNDPERH